MPTPIEALELQVQSNGNTAVAGIDALSASLTRLKTATKGGIGLTSVANQLKNLNSALASMDGSAAAKIDRLATSLDKLKNLGNLKISSSIGNQLKNIGNAATALNGVDFSGLSKLSTAMGSLGTIGRASGLQSAITQLQRIPQLVATLNGVNWNQFTAQIQRLTNALAPLANQLNTVSAAFNNLPANIRRVVTATNAMPSANNAAAKSYLNLWAKARMAYNVVRMGAQVITSWITQSNKYIEDLNLFNVSMGEYADQAHEYVERVSAIMGIDPAEWMRNQGVFNTITKGFGVASDRAYIMSKNLTQLGYDLSSFFNISYEDAFQKLQSGIAGELEPLRRLGYDLSVARLQEEALALGITKKVSAMTQAEKSELRYYAIMTQVTAAQGDMVRTLNAPANQLRILQAEVTQAARALGNIFIPILNAVLPYAIALARVIRMLASAIASLFGFKLPEVDYGGISAGAGAIGDLADNADNAAGGLGGAAEKAKELKKALLGIDELHILSPPEDTGGSGSGAGGSGGVGGDGLGFDLPEYDFLGETISSKVDEIMAKWKSFIDWVQTHLGEILKTAVAIGTALAAWKVAKGLMQFIEWFKNLTPKNLQFGIEFKALGLVMFLADLNEFMKYLEDFKDNGPTFHNVAGMISEFSGLVGDALIVLGQLKLGGALKVVQGVGEIVVTIEDIANNGVDWENAGTAIRGLTNIAIGIGVFTGNVKFAAWSVAIQGFTSIITEFGKNWDAIRQGDWSGVDKVTLITGGLELLGGLVVALDVFSKLKGLTSIGQATTAVQTVTQATGTLDTTTATLSPNLTSLAKNLGMGLVVITEIAAAVLLITGAIILLGLELEQVGIAWEPVIANGGTIATAMGIGVGILVVVGVVTALLGSAGTTLIVNIALGTAVLAELGVATALFIAEIWGIGYGLDQIGQAWQPVLNNGDTIATAIGLGTAILVGVGVVTAALGVATVATAGLLPLAIGLGTAILVELGVAAAAFITEVWGIGKGLAEIGDAWQPVLDKGDTVSTGIAVGTGLLIAIGVATAALGVATVASAGLLPVAIGLGTSLLIELSAATIAFTESLVAVADEMTDNLAPALEDFNKVLPDLSVNMSNFVTYMSEFAGHVVTYSQNSLISAIASTIDTIIGWFTQDPLEKLANDVGTIGGQAETLKTNLDTAVPVLEDAVEKLSSYSTLLTTLDSSISSMTQLSSSKCGSLNTNVKISVSLEKSGWTTFKNWIGTVPTIEQNVSLKKSGWTTVKNWIGTLPVISQGISLQKSGWTSIKTWIGAVSDVLQGVALSKSGWTTVSGWVSNSIGGSVTVTVNLRKGWEGTLKKWRGLEDGGIIGANGSIKVYGSGGIITPNSFWNAIPKYAGGISKPHGSMFVAGENGAELVGHVNGNTEVLNRFQLGQVMHTSIIGGMRLFTGYWRTMNSQMVQSANAIISSILVSADTITASLASPSGYDPYRTMTRTIFEEGNSAYNDTESDESMYSSMRDFYREFVEPTIKEIAADTKRQADKEERTVVQIGSRTITETVDTQRKANGYVFAK